MASFCQLAIAAMAQAFLRPPPAMPGAAPRYSPPKPPWEAMRSLTEAPICGKPAWHTTTKTKVGCKQVNDTCAGVNQAILSRVAVKCEETALICLEKLTSCYLAHVFQGFERPNDEIASRAHRKRDRKLAVNVGHPIGLCANHVVGPEDVQQHCRRAHRL